MSACIRTVVTAENNDWLVITEDIEYLRDHEKRQKRIRTAVAYIPD